jgi:hypothetical protein
MNITNPVESIIMTGKVMKQHRLGVSFKTKNGTYWIIHDTKKYEKMRNADIEKYYNKGATV